MSAGRVWVLQFCALLRYHRLRQANRLLEGNGQSPVDEIHLSPARNQPADYPASRCNGNCPSFWHGSILVQPSARRL